MRFLKALCMTTSNAIMQCFRLGINDPFFPFARTSASHVCVCVRVCLSFSFHMAYHACVRVCVCVRAYVHVCVVVCVCMFCLIPVMKLWVFFLFLPESDTVKFLPLPKPVSP